MRNRNGQKKTAGVYGEFGLVNYTTQTICKNIT